jgi:hypothetical protein
MKGPRSPNERRWITVVTGPCTKKVTLGHIFVTNIQRLKVWGNLGGYCPITRSAKPEEFDADFDLTEHKVFLL